MIAIVARTLPRAIAATPGGTMLVTRPAKAHCCSTKLFSFGQFTLALIVALAVIPARASNPSSGTITDSSTTLTYAAGPFDVPNVTDSATGTPTCSATIPAEQCDTFALTVNVAPGDATTKQISIAISFANSAGEFDLFVFDSKNDLIASDTAGGEPSSVVIPAVSGTYSIVVDPWNPLGQSFVGNIALQTIPVAPPPPPGIPPRYQTYAAPSTAGGANASGEPSIGVDYNPNVASLKHGTVNQGGVAFFTANLAEFRVSFDDCSSPANTHWEAVTSPVETVNTLDPIGFCDHFGGAPTPGRVFQSQLAGASSLLAYSDNDGNSWTPSQGSGQPAGVDHQTLGAGPYNPNATPPPPPHPLYANAFYYCSQDSETAFCSRSDDGGLTFGPGVPIYNFTQCGGIHGHVKVAPDGSVYVPNKQCGANQGFAVSTDNGLTWAVRTIPDSLAAIGLTDPSLGIASDGTVYFGYQDGSGHPKIAVSHDRGLTWASSIDAGAQLGIQNSTFPEVVAGDPNRAAFMYLGTPTGGNYEDPTNFLGIWHLYVATTFDGGNSYVTVDATPNDPVQVGSICNLGTTGCQSNSAGGADRNMLDFMDLTIDSQGRVVGAFADGCVVGSCDATSSPSASRSALGTILRQSGGRRLLSAFDPVEPAKPPAPLLGAALQSKTGVLLNWQAPDNGGSPITGYQIFRGTTSGEMLLANIPAAKSVYLDKTAKSTTQYFYRVAAKNKLGAGPLCGEVATTPAPPLQSACILPGITVVNDPAGDQTGAPGNSQLDIQSISVAELFNSSASGSQLYFTMQVSNLGSPLPPNAQWVIFFIPPNGTEYFVAMDTTSNPATPAFTYGHVTTLATGNPSLTTDGTADAGSNFNANGTILIIIDNSKVGSPHPGDQLVNINGETQLEVGAAGTGLLETIDNTSAGRYILLGNQACALKPVLTAKPVSGSAPLTVNFSGAGSTDPDGQTINSYTFTFGDGNSVTQPGTTTHNQYFDPGTFTATLSLADSTGATSPTPASVTINVTPSSCPTKTAGSGKVSGTDATFTLNAIESNLTGSFAYSDPVNKIKFTSTTFTTNSLSGRCVTFGGTANLSTGGQVNYTATACDNNTTGTKSPDTFAIQISGAASSSQSGPLSTGNITIAYACPAP
jgi:PKD domain